MADTVQLDTGGLDFNMDFSDNKPAASADDVSLTFTAPETQSTEQTIQFESPSPDETLPHIEMPSLNLEFEDAAVHSAENVEDKNDIPDIGSLDLAQGEPVSAAPELVEPPKEESALDFNFDLGGTTEPIEMPSVQAETQKEPASSETGLDLSGISLDMEAPEEVAGKQEAEGAEQESEEVNTKLDLVTAYMDMGDSEGARELLDEVLKEGGPRQRQRAQELFNSLS